MIDFQKARARAFCFPLVVTKVYDNMWCTWKAATPVQVYNILSAGKIYSGQLQRANRRRKADKLYSQRENLELDSGGVYKAAPKII